MYASMGGAQPQAEDYLGAWGANPPSGEDLLARGGSPPSGENLGYAGMGGPGNQGAVQNPADALGYAQRGGPGGSGPIPAPGEGFPGGGPLQQTSITPWQGQPGTQTPPPIGYPGGPYGIGGSLPLPLAPQQQGGGFAQPGGPGGTGPLSGENGGAVSPGGPGGTGPISGEGGQPVNTDPLANFNNGNPPQAGLQWNGTRWTAPGAPADLGTPTLPTGGAINTTAPAPYNAFGPTAQINPSYANAASANPAYSQSAYADPAYARAAGVNPVSAQHYLDEYGGMLGASLEPTFQRQRQQLSADLRSRGINDSGAAAQLEGDQMAQQLGVYAGQFAPMVSQGFGYAQQDVTGNAANQQAVNLQNAGNRQSTNMFNASNLQNTSYANQAADMQARMANAGYAQQANLANAGIGNEAALTNANYYSQAQNQNYAAYNNYLNELLGLGAGNFGALQAAYLNSYGPNTGVTSAYNNALAGTQNAYANTYAAAAGGQGAGLSGAFGALGSYLGKV